MFQFDTWHITPLMCKQYAKEIIKYCNNNPIRNSIVEIGCGLGDILRNVHYKNKKGYDIDQNVLKAARFLSFWKKERNNTFSIFIFPNDKLEDKYDIIVMVNWIHNIQPNILKENIEKYFLYNLNQDGSIIIDTVQDNEYKVNHDIKFLINDLSCKIIEIGNYERQRTVWAIQKY
jgi:SAM-dependent methyltransferase